MGKSFANFMCKKFFHPSSFANIKRVWLAEQRVADETKKQDELRAEYERDQDHYNNRQLMGDERVKHGLTFIYEAPKAYQKELNKEPGDKLEWKRATPAQGSTSSSAGSSKDHAGPVRNVRCVRCHQMGHIPTDRECPMYKASEEDGSSSRAVHQDELVEDMRRDGYAFKQSVLGRSVNDANFSKDLVAEDESDEGPPPEEAFLSSLTKKQKKKLLKKLNRMEKRHSGSVHKKKSTKKRRRTESSSSDEEPKPRKSHKKHKKHRKAEESSDDSSSSDESSDERHRHHSKQSRRRRDSSSQERDGYKKGSKRRRDEDSGSEDERNGRVAYSRDGCKVHDGRKEREHGQSTKKENGSFEKGDVRRRSKHEGRPRSYSSSDDDSPSESNYSRRDRNYPDYSSRHHDESSHRHSHRERDSREREEPRRLQVEKDRGDDRRDRGGDRPRDREGERRLDRQQSDRRHGSHSGRHDDRNGGRR